MCIYLHSFQLLAASLTTIYMYTLAGARVRAPSVFTHSLAHACVHDFCLCFCLYTHSHTWTVTQVRKHMRILASSSFFLAHHI